MERRRWVRGIARSIIVLLTATLFSGVHSPTFASLDFPENTNISPSINATDFDSSASGDVIAAVVGYNKLNYYISDPGYIYISTDGGANFTEQTSLGKQVWRGIEVSEDGKSIAAFTSNTVFFSTNSGSSFTRIHSIDGSDARADRVILDGSLSGNGRVFYFVFYDRVMRLTYDSIGKRWIRTLNTTMPDYQEASNVAANSDGTIAYIAARSLFKVTANSMSEILVATNFRDNGNFLWNDITTSKTGNEVIALPLVFNGAGKFYKSVNGGSSFSIITTINGTAFDQISSITLSGDGTATFFSTDSVTKSGRIYSQHGSNAQWYERYTYSYFTGFDQMTTDNTGSIVILRQDALPISILRGTPDKPSLIINGASAAKIAISYENRSRYLAPDLPALTDMQLQYATSASGPWITYDDGVGANQYDYVDMRGPFTQGSNYLRIRAKNFFGYGPWSDIKSVIIKGLPSVPPAPRQLSTVDKSELAVEFGVPSDLGGDLQVPYQTLLYSLDLGAYWFVGGNSPYPISYTYSNSSNPNVPTSATIKGLPSATPIMVMTYSGNSQSANFSPPSTFYVYTKPSAVTNLQVNTVYSNATLSWGAPSDLGGGTISYYKYSYKRSTDSSWTTESTTSTSAAISGLQGGTLYDYKVQAITTLNVESLEAFLYNDQTTNPPIKLSMNRNSSGARSSIAFSTQPKVSLLDVTNSIVTGESRAIVVASINNGGILIGRDTATAVSGIATFSNLGIKGKAGTTYTITYRSSNLTVSSETVTLQAGTPVGIKFETNAVGGKHGVVFETQTVLNTVDIDGNFVNTDTTTVVTLSASEGFLWNGSSATPSVTAVNGRISFTNVRIDGEAGRRPVLTYSASGMQSIQETITITTGLASTFTRVIRAQDAYVGSRFGTQPTYQVTDSAGNVVTTGSYLITVTPSIGTILGNNSVLTINGIATFTNLGLTGVDAGRLVNLSVSSPEFTTYTGDSIITRTGYPKLAWSDFYIPRGTSPFTIPKPDSSTSGTFSYTSSNSGVISISGSTVTVGNSGTATITATFTPSDTNNYFSGETVTSVFTVLPSGGNLVVAAPGGVAQKGVRNTLTASSSDDGAVTFFINGKKIPGCIGVRTQSTVATCSWKPAIQGSVTLSAILVPNNDQIDSVKSGTVTVPVVRRTGRR